MSHPAHAGRMLFVNAASTNLDAHGWQVVWMDPVAAEQGPEAFAQSAQARQDGSDAAS